MCPRASERFAADRPQARSEKRTCGLSPPLGEGDKGSTRERSLTTPKTNKKEQLPLSEPSRDTTPSPKTPDGTVNLGNKSDELATRFPFPPLRPTEGKKKRKRKNKRKTLNKNGLER